jgi:uncharacterized repeat protein (TIGR01451 family)
MQRHISTTIALLFAMAATPAMAAPKMTMNMTAEKDVVVVEKGKQVKKRVEAKNQVSGEVVIYTINYRNEGDEAATNVKFDNKVPDGAAYVAESAKGDADITFSVDSGKTYKKPALLTYEIVNAEGKKETVTASPEKYTDIRWIITQVPAGGSGQIGYEVRIK